MLLTFSLNRRNQKGYKYMDFHTYLMNTKISIVLGAYIAIASYRLNY